MCVYVWMKMTQENILNDVLNEMELNELETLRQELNHPTLAHTIRYLLQKASPPTDYNKLAMSRFYQQLKTMGLTDVESTIGDVERMQIQKTMGFASSTVRVYLNRFVKAGFMVKDTQYGRYKAYIVTQPLTAEAVIEKIIKGGIR